MGHARRIVTFEWMTADGFFAGPDGNLDWVVPDEEQAKAAAGDISNFDTVLFGCRTPKGAARILLQVAAKHPGAVWDVVRPRTKQGRSKRPKQNTSTPA